MPRFAKSPRCAEMPAGAAAEATAIATTSLQEEEAIDENRRRLRRRILGASVLDLVRASSVPWARWQDAALPQAGGAACRPSSLPGRLVCAAGTACPRLGLEPGMCRKDVQGCPCP